MKVKILRNLNPDLVARLTADGVEVPTPHEGSEFDVSDDLAKELFDLQVAEATDDKDRAKRPRPGDPPRPGDQSKSGPPTPPRAPGTPDEPPKKR